MGSTMVQSWIISPPFTPVFHTQGWAFTPERTFTAITLRNAFEFLDGVFFVLVCARSRLRPSKPRVIAGHANVSVLTITVQYTARRNNGWAFLRATSKSLGHTSLPRDLKTR